MIDDLGPQYLSPAWGLLDQQGFEVVAAKHNLRADISWHLTYNQILYLTNVLGLPVIVNFRRTYGYYFIKSLTRDVFDGLWQWRGDGTAMTVVIVPKDYQYTLPPV
jgi:hypothetical protein